MMQPLYVEHAGWLQRQPAARKLLALMVAGASLFLVPSAVALLAAVVGVAGLLVMSGVSWRGFWLQARWLLVLWLAVVVVTAIWQAPVLAVPVGLRLLALMGLALVLSFTTRTADLIDAVEHALQPWHRRGWVRADRLAFMVGLTLRFVPELQRRWHIIREAQIARGIRVGPVTLAVPLVVAVLQSAEAIAEALDARGYD